MDEATMQKNNKKKTKKKQHINKRKTVNLHLHNTDFPSHYITCFSEMDTHKF